MVNKVILIGNLGKDPEVRYTSGGQAVCAMRIATSRSWNDKQSGTRKEETEWHDIEVWGKQAEACGEHLVKGRSVFVEGRLKTDTWEKDGQKHWRIKIVAENVRFLGGGKGGGERPAGGAGGGAPADDGGETFGGGAPGDDIPF